MTEAFLQTTLQDSVPNNHCKSGRLTNDNVSTMRSTKPTTASTEMILSVHSPNNRAWSAKKGVS